MIAPGERLAARLRALRSRAAVRGWELRRLDHAGGAWYRVTRLLALSCRAWAISEEDASLLLARGRRPDPAGLALQPPRRYFVLDEEEVSVLRGAQEVVLQSSTELLSCRDLALVPFAGASGSGGVSAAP